MSFGLAEDVVKRIQSVFARYPEIDQVVIYGSRAKGTFRTGSDIDLTLKGHNLTERHLSLIQQALDDLNTPYLFDVSIFEQLAAPDLENHITRVGKVFYQSNAKV